jgi:hypothetical protein
MLLRRRQSGGDIESLLLASGNVHSGSGGMNNIYISELEVLASKECL